MAPSDYQTSIMNYFIDISVLWCACYSLTTTKWRDCCSSVYNVRLSWNRIEFCRVFNAADTFMWKPTNWCSMFWLRGRWRLKPLQCTAVSRFYLFIVQESWILFSRLFEMHSGMFENDWRSKVSWISQKSLTDEYHDLDKKSQ